MQNYLVNPRARWAHPGLATAGSSNHSPPPEGCWELVRARWVEGSRQELQLGLGPHRSPLPRPKPSRSHKNKRAQAIRSTGPVPWDTEQVLEEWRRPNRPRGRGRQTESNPHKLLLYIGESSAPWPEAQARGLLPLWGDSAPHPVCSPHDSDLPLALAGLIVAHVAWWPCLVNLPLTSGHRCLPTGLWAPGGQGLCLCWSPCVPRGSNSAWHVTDRGGYLLGSAHSFLFPGLVLT